MRVLLGISLVIAIIVVIMELSWLGKSDLAPILITLAVAISLQAVYLLQVKK